MELLNADVYASREALQKLADKELPIAISFQLARLIIAVQPTLTAIETLRYKLVKQWGTADEDNPGKIQVPEDKLSDFNNVFDELLGQSVEYDIDKIKLPETVSSTCAGCGTVTEKPLEIEPSTLVLLDKFVEI